MCVWTTIGKSPQLSQRRHAQHTAHISPAANTKGINPETVNEQHQFPPNPPNLSLLLPPSRKQQKRPNGQHPPVPTRPLSVSTPPPRSNPNPNNKDKTYLCTKLFSASGSTFFPSGLNTTGRPSTGCSPFSDHTTLACGPNYANKVSNNSPNSVK